MGKVIMNSFKKSLDAVFEHFGRLPAGMSFRKYTVSSLGSRLINGVGWSLFGSVVSKGLAFLSAIFVARLLLPESYGQLGLLRATVMLFVELCDGCFGDGAAKFIAEHLVVDKGRVGRIICLNYTFAVIIGTICAFTFFIASPVLSEKYFCNKDLIHSVQAAAFLLLILLINSVQKGVLTGFQDFRGLNCSGMVAAVISCPSMIVGVWQAGVMGAIVGLAVAALLSLAINSVYIYHNMKRHEIRYSFRNVSLDFLQILKTNSALFLQGLLMAISMWYAKVMLIETGEDGFKQLGIFIAMMQCYTIVCFFPNQLAKIIVPIASTVLAEKNHRKFRKLVAVVSIAVLGVGLAVALPMAIFSKPFASLFGSGYESGANYLGTMAFAAILSALYVTFSLFIISMGKSVILLPIALAGAITLTGTSRFLFLHDYGANGLVIALCLSWGIQSVLSGCYVFFMITSRNRE